MNYEQYTAIVDELQRASDAARKVLSLDREVRAAFGELEGVAQRLQKAMELVAWFAHPSLCGPPKTETITVQADPVHKKPARKKTTKRVRRKKATRRAKRR